LGTASPLLLRLARHQDEWVAVASEPAGAELTYGALSRRSAARARNLCRTIGDRAGAVAFLVEPGPLFVETLVAIWKAGRMAVPLSPLHARPELEYVIGNAVPAAAIASRALASRLADLAPAAGPLIAEDLAAQEQGVLPELPPWPEPDADGLMLYTSGTTGKPKGVRLTHRALAATVEALEEAWRWRQDDRLLHVLPLHHTHGLIVALLGALWAGAETRFVPFVAADVWERLDDATVLMAVPTMYAKLMEEHQAAPSELRARWAARASGLRLCTSGSASLPAALLEAFAGATGQTILERYGMTEIGMALSNSYDGARVPGAVGRELPGVVVDIVDDAGRPAAAGEAGELRVRSPQMFSGYHGDADATASAFDEQGRFRTGDTGVRDDGGVVRLLGRTSVDIIKSGGYKLSALEIEAVLIEHPAVAEAAVIGEPDATWGERVTACVVVRPGTSLTLDDLQAFCREKMAGYKLPRALREFPALPRNAMGKVQKQLLRPRT
jgi:malonyl-CoA/methylmalonyl-CoA synthetase